MVQPASATPRMSAPTMRKFMMSPSNRFGSEAAPHPQQLGAATLLRAAGKAVNFNVVRWITYKRERALTPQCGGSFHATYGLLAKPLRRGRGRVRRGCRRIG